MNFWSSAFRLPRACTKQIESLCSAFLWSGPDLNTHKAKVSWQDICLPKSEGGLGIRPLKETNKVSGLKLLWRLLTSKSSLWGQWAQTNLIRQHSFWSLRDTSNQGSWMWRKILKLRDTAKEFHTKDIKSGAATSFWYERWSSMGVLFDILGDRGHLDLGISKTATMEEVFNSHRRRRHRLVILNRIEDKICEVKEKRKQDEEDIHLWKWGADYKNKFSTRETWIILRKKRPKINWAKGVWFPQATPKFAFITWLAMHNRLSTGDRMEKWNQGANTTCFLCQQRMEERNHIFFKCRLDRDPCLQHGDD